MDKNRIDNDKKAIEVYKVPKKPIPEILRQYGLWALAPGSSRAPAWCYYANHLRYYEFYCLSHLWDGAGRVNLNGVERDMKIGDCIFLKPGAVHLYGSPSAENYCEDTITFLGPVADQLAAAGIFRNKVVNIGRVRRLLPIITLLRDPAEDSLIQGNIELQKFLVEVYLSRHEDKREYPLFEKLQQEIRNHLDRWWTVSDMAEMCNLSDDQLRRVFLEHTGTTPKQYVDQLKIARADELLRENNGSIAAIAESLGYVDPYHFSRRFKQLQGVSPEKYRKEFVFRKTTKVK